MYSKTTENHGIVPDSKTVPIGFLKSVSFDRHRDIYFLLIAKIVEGHLIADSLQQKSI
jgi:hypothetical protein